MTANEIFARLAAGFGLLILALQILKSNLQELSSGKMRTFIKNRTSSGLSAAVWGVALGIATSSSTIVGIIASSLYTCHSILYQRALLLVIWSVVGTSFWYFILFLHIETAILYLLGLSSLLFYIQKPFHWRNAIGVVMAICLMLFSLQLMGSHLKELGSINWIKDNMAAMHGAFLQPFVIGALLFLALQSGLVILILLASLSISGAIDASQALFMLYGMNFGGMIMNGIVSLSLRGMIRHILVVQALFNGFFAVSFALLLALELTTGIPLVKTLSETLATSIWQQLVIVVLIGNVATASFLSITLPLIARLLNGCCPLAKASDPALPKYIDGDNLLDPESSLDLASKEILELLQRLPKILDYHLSHGDGSEKEETLAREHANFRSICTEVNQYLLEMHEKKMSPETADKSLTIVESLQLIISLEEGTHQLITMPMASNEELNTLAQQICESQQFLLETILEAIDTSNQENVELLLKATHNIKPRINAIENSYMKKEALLSMANKSTVLTMTSLFERNMWLLQRLVYQFLPHSS